MKINGKRWIGWGLAAVALAVLLAWAFWPRPAEVDMATVGRGELVVTLDEEGETRVRERYVVSAPVAGKVLRIELEPGDPVVAGETVVATFQPGDPVPLDARSRAEAEARVRSAEAALRSTRARAEAAAASSALAATELERIRALAADGIAPQSQLDSAAAAARSRREERQAAELDADRARHEVEQARAMLLEATTAHGGNPGAGGADPLTLTAPVDGVVLRRMRESESVVPVGEPLLEVGDPGKLEIVADYLSTDAVRIDPGDRVVIDRWGGDEPLTGRVRRVEPSGFLKVSALGVEEQRVNVIFDFDSPHHAFAALGDNYRVEVRTVVWEGQEVLQVPTSALFRRGDSWAVFAVEDGRVVLETVQIGHRNSLSAELLGGLQAGARVVVHPSDSLAEGDEVKERSSS